MKDQIPVIEKEALERIEAAADARALEDARVGVLGKKGTLSVAAAGMKDVPKEDKAEVGQLLNAARQAITDHVHDLADQGLSVLWTTHLTDEVRDTDALVVLHKGQIIDTGTAGTLRGDHTLSDWFLARTKVPA